MPAPFLPRILKLHDWPENCRPSKIWAFLWGLPILELCLPCDVFTNFSKPELFFRSLSRWPNEPTCAEACVELVELKSVRKSTQVFQRKSTKDDRKSSVYAWNLWLFTTCESVWPPFASPFVTSVDLRRLASSFGQRLNLQTIYVPDAALLARGTPGDLCSSGKRSKGKVSGTQGACLLFYNTKKKITYFLGSRCLRSAR